MHPKKSEVHIGVLYKIGERASLGFIKISTLCKKYTCKRKKTQEKNHLHGL